jgi:hypothetical protein
VFLVRSEAECHPCPVVSRPDTLLLQLGEARYVWSRPPLLRCQRDQAPLLDPAESPHPDPRAQLECRANRPAAGSSLR